MSTSFRTVMKANIRAAKKHVRKMASQFKRYERQAEKSETALEKVRTVHTKHLKAMYAAKEMLSGAETDLYHAEAALAKAPAAKRGRKKKS
jgi:hypothetical protein